MGLPIETQKKEIVLEVEFKVRPSLHPHKFFEKYVTINLQPHDNSLGKIETITFKGINYGWLQLIPRIKKVKPILKKKGKKNMKVTKKDIDWICNATFGRHADPDNYIKKFTLKQIAKILLTVWEGSKK